MSVIPEVFVRHQDKAGNTLYRPYLYLCRETTQLAGWIVRERLEMKRINDSWKLQEIRKSKRLAPRYLMRCSTPKPSKTAFPAVIALNSWISPRAASSN